MSKKCIKCFKDYNEEYGDICPYCGFVNTNVKPMANELCPGVFLHNRYLIGIKIASGGFGIIYKAWDLNLKIVVAIKEYFPVSMATRTIGEVNVHSVNRKFEMKYKEGKDRFLYEARMLAKFFEHPNIVKCYGFFEENNTAYIVQEYLSGKSVSELLKDKKIDSQNGTLSWEETMPIIDGVLNALESIHKDGLVHRDIAPDNIFMENGIVKLIDFGAIWPINDKDFHYNKEVVIKSGYAPVEQYNLKEKVGAYTDIYALGATIFRIVTGVIPYESTDRENDKNKGLSLEKITDYVTDFPIEISNIVDRMMAVQKEVRFQSVKEIKEAFCSEKPVLTSFDFEIKLKQRKKYMLMFVGLLCVSFIAFITFIFNEKSKGIKNINVSKDTIVVAIPYANELEKEVYKNIVSGFEKENSQIKVDLKMIPSNEYSQELKSNPTVFFKDDSISDKECVDLTKLKSSISKSEYLLFDTIEKQFNNRAIPISFDCNVTYINKSLIKDTLSELSYKQINEKKYSLSINPYFLTTVRDKNTLINYSDNQGSKTDFLSGKKSLYIGKLSEYKEVQNALIGQYSIISINDSQFIESIDRLAINKNTTENQQYAAMYFIYYMLSDAAQSPMYINRFSQIDGLPLSFPVNLKTFNRYSTSINNEIEFLSDTLKVANVLDEKAKKNNQQIEKWLSNQGRTKEELDSILE